MAFVASRTFCVKATLFRAPVLTMGSHPCALGAPFCRCDRLQFDHDCGGLASSHFLSSASVEIQFRPTRSFFRGPVPNLMDLSMDLNKFL
ncbi:hypothetical protein C8F04DRAFT_189694 [Mycena alexandri]|uniref:Uncharacterized protein n=1 Tax=Mycena alexandri TaxID=1745969 RepID=A0AAD6WSE4_9AGAR|nr:hypothetical protein C8F04DRAFT_189694 [Mycena alexandri]